MNTIDDETKQRILECISCSDKRRKDYLKEGKKSSVSIEDSYMSGMAIVVMLMGYELVVEEKDGSTNVADIRRKE